MLISRPLPALILIPVRVLVGTAVVELRLDGVLLAK